MTLHTTLRQVLYVGRVMPEISGTEIIAQNE